jgi:GH18 family chitinase
MNRLSSLLLLVIIFAGCGGGSSSSSSNDTPVGVTPNPVVPTPDPSSTPDPASTPDPTPAPVLAPDSSAITISGVAFANSVQSSTVEIDVIHIDGTVTPTVGSGTSGDDGHFTIVILTNTLTNVRAFVVRATGGQYQDEARAEGMTDLVGSIRSVIVVAPSVDLSSAQQFLVAVTPFTEATVRVSESAAGAIAVEEVAGIARQLADQFFGDGDIDILATLPTPLDGVGGEHDASQYALALAGLSQLQQRLRMNQADLLKEIMRSVNSDGSVNADFLARYGEALITYIARVNAGADDVVMMSEAVRGVLSQNAQIEALLTQDTGSSTGGSAEPIVPVYEAGQPYGPGEIIQVDGTTYTCRAFPEGHWCRLAVYEPTGPIGNLAWEQGGATAPPATAAQLVVTGYISGTGYQSADNVNHLGTIYRCKPWPFTGWCGQRTPGVDNGWAEAWEIVDGATVETATGEIAEGALPALPRVTVPTVVYIDSNDPEDPQDVANYMVSWFIDAGGVNADSWSLREGLDTLVTESISDGGRNRQRGEFIVRNRDVGLYEYTVTVSRGANSVTTDVAQVQVLLNPEAELPAPDDGGRTSPIVNNEEGTEQLPPGKPLITPFWETIAVDNPFSVAWTLWWGINGDHWRLYEDDAEVFAGDITAQGRREQRSIYTDSAGEASIGTRNYYVRLCRNYTNADATVTELCTNSDVVTATFAAIDAGGGAPVVDAGGGSSNMNPAGPGTQGSVSPNGRGSILAPALTVDPIITAGNKVVGYFTEWGVYARDYQVADIPAHKLSTINYAFVDVDIEGNPVLLDTYADLDKNYAATDSWAVSTPNSDPCATVNTSGVVVPNVAFGVDGALVKGNFKQLCVLKVKYPHLELVLSFGGWTRSGNFYPMAGNATARANFATQAVALARRYGFDGIDIDWEFPVRGGLQEGSVVDRVNFTAMMQALRSSINADSATGVLSAATGLVNERLLLTAAVYAGPEDHSAIGLSGTGIDFLVAEPLMDYIYVMAYDFHGGWEAGTGRTGHNAPLNNNNDHLGAEFNIMAAVNKVRRNGGSTDVVPNSKLILGTPFYGRNAGGVSRGNNGYGQPFTTSPEGTYEKGFRDYWDIAQNFKNLRGFQYFWDDTARVPYLFNSGGREFVSFDDPTSIKVKASFAKNSGLAGVMFWELSGDTREVTSDGLSPESGVLLTATLAGLADPTYASSDRPAVDVNALVTTVVEAVDPETENTGSVNGLTTFDALPLRYRVVQGGERIISFQEPIVSVAVSRSSIATASLDTTNNRVTINGLLAGRGSLKLNLLDGREFFVGIAVDNTGETATSPKLPSYLTIGSVSEDSVPDLRFWGDFGYENTLQNKEMDIRYIYINGGPNQNGDGKDFNFNSWRTSNRTLKFAQESVRYGMVPFFVYYNIPDGGESYQTDLAHTQSTEYMQAYFKDLRQFLSDVQDVMGDDLYGIILEPDFLGYMQQLSGKRPEQIKTWVRFDETVGDDGKRACSNVLTGGPITYSDPYTFTGDIDFDAVDGSTGSIASLVRAINCTIFENGGNVLFGWQLNLWADQLGAGNKGLLRATDADSSYRTIQQASRANARDFIRAKADSIINYGLEAGILSEGAGFVSIDKYGLDAQGHQNRVDPHDSTWFFNADHWNNYLELVRVFNRTSGAPILLWQLPVGHINGSQETSAYTGARFTDFPNTSRRFEDSSPNYFLGDSFDTGGNPRLSYFATNENNDAKVSAQGDVVTWQSHMQEAADAGVFSILFGAGVGDSTDGVGIDQNLPTDNYYWIQKVQQYYQERIELNPIDYCSIAYVDESRARTADASFVYRADRSACNELEP